MKKRNARFVGVIPAAGVGSRLASLVYPKELLSIDYQQNSIDSTMRPTPVMAHSLELMRRAGVEKVCVVISDRKFEIARVFGNGEAQGMSLCYVMRNVPRGWQMHWREYAVDADHNVCFALPDTVIEPANALNETCALLQATNADLVLGVFPTKVPEQLGPVRLRNGGIVVEVYDKPKKIDLKNTWGFAVWRPTFSSFLADATAASAGGQAGPALGDVFQSAVEAGLDVRAKYFRSGRLFDLGTPEGLEVFQRWSTNRSCRAERLAKWNGNRQMSRHAVGAKVLLLALIAWRAGGLASTWATSWRRRDIIHML